MIITTMITIIISFQHNHIDYAERIVEFIADNNVIKPFKDYSNYKVHLRVYLYVGEREFRTKTMAIEQRKNN